MARKAKSHHVPIYAAIAEATSTRRLSSSESRNFVNFRLSADLSTKFIGVKCRELIFAECLTVAQVLGGKTTLFYQWSKGHEIPVKNIVIPRIPQSPTNPDNISNWKPPTEPQHPFSQLFYEPKPNLKG